MAPRTAALLTIQYLEVEIFQLREVVLRADLCLYQKTKKVGIEPYPQYVRRFGSPGGVSAQFRTYLREASVINGRPETWVAQDGE